MTPWRQGLARKGAMLAVAISLCVGLSACASSIYPFQKSESVQDLLATRPPEDGWRPATPADVASVDYETVYGPGHTGPGGSPATVPANPALPESEAIIGSLSPAPSLVPAEKAPDSSPSSTVPASASAPASVSAKSGTARPDIRAVAIIAVRNAGPLDNASLTQAMRETLAGAGWPVVEAPRKDALTIFGTVTLAPPVSGQQAVAVAWVVAAPGGAILGTIRQANTVPAGSLDTGWGPAARDVAEGAALGIFDLIKKYR